MDCRRYVGAAAADGMGCCSEGHRVMVLEGAIEFGEMSADVIAEQRDELFEEGCSAELAQSPDDLLIQVGLLVGSFDDFPRSRLGGDGASLHPVGQVDRRPPVEGGNEVVRL